MTQKKTLSPTDYLVGWITALPIELAIAKRMLDEVHSLPNASEFQADETPYTLGQIHDHNVVIACLPMGIYGTVSAALAVHQMLCTFPRIQYALLVGVGGGAPSMSADIRLGDVVVSTPTRGYGTGTGLGGVLAYDCGKTTTGGRFRCHGAMNKPPLALLRALAEVKAGCATHARSISNTLRAIRAKEFPIMDGDIGYPGRERDFLFESTYEHAEPGREGCDACDRGRCVSRSERAFDGPAIHYGLIASGNRVIKHARMRDQFAQRFGIICFEMEAAGIMDQLPCLVIKGICDYSDSHKNKEWQGYAATTAAAYARELLLTVNVGRIHAGVRPPRGHWRVPLSRNLLFTGRQQQLDELDKAIRTNSQITKIAITGLGGVGKTQIALEAAYRAREEYPLLSIFWVSAANAKGMEQSYVEVARVLGVAVKEPAEAEREVTRHLRANVGPWLLLIDEVDDLDGWNTRGAYLDPSTSNGIILLTTRSRKLAVKMASLQVFEIPAMNMHEGEQLLRNHLLNTNLLHDHESCRRLLGKLMSLPLAVRQAAAYVNENGISLTDYLSLLDGQEEDLIDLFGEELSNEAHPLISTWTVSFTKILKEDSLAAEYLAFMSCYDPRNIPSSLLPPKGSLKKQTDSIGTLNAYAFVTRSSTSTGGLFLNFHGLVHLATRHWLRQSQTLPLWTSKALHRLNNVFPEPDHRHDLEYWRRYLPHVNYMIRMTKEMVSWERVDLLEKYGLSLFHDGRYQESEEALYTVLQAKTRYLSDHHPETMNSMNNVAVVYGAQCRLSTAEALQMRVWTKGKEVLGEMHTYILAAMNSLATIYQKQGRWHDAETMGRVVVEHRISLLGRDHPFTINSMGNLSCTYRELGRWEDAEKLAYEVFTMQTDISGEQENQDALRSMNNLALIYLNQGQGGRAQKFSARAAQVSERVLGATHPDTIVSLGNLAYIYNLQGCFAEAEKLGTRALQLSKEVLGGEHASTLVSMANLAGFRKDLGRDRDAMELIAKCYRACRKVLGQGHPYTESFGETIREWQGSFDRILEADYQIPCLL